MTAMQPNLARPRAASGGPALSRLVRASSLYMVANLASRAVGFLAVPFYSRFLSPAEYGLIELIELSTQVVAISLGLQTFGTVITRLFHKQPTPAGKRDVISTGLLSSALLNAFILAAAVLFSAPLAQAVFRSAEHAPLLQAAFAAMFFSNLIEVALVYERIQERAGFYLAYSLATLFLTLGLNVLFIGVLGAGVWGFVASKLLVASCGAAYLARRLVRDVGRRWCGDLVPHFVRLAVPLTFSGLCYLVIHSSDRFFLTSYVSLEDIGRYALAYRFAFLITVLVGESFRKSWEVTFYRYAEQAGWQDGFGRVVCYLVLAEVAAALALAVCGQELLAFMVPPAFRPPPLLLPVLVLAYAVRDIGELYHTLLLVNQRTRTIASIALSGAVLNLGLNALLIPAYGIHGAALATLLTWLAYTAVCCTLARREHGVPVPLTSMLGLVALALGAFALSCATRVEGLALQCLLDAFWVLLFAAVCLAVYLPAEDRPALRARFVWFTARLHPWPAGR